MALGMVLLNIDIYEGTPSTQLGPNMGMEATSLSRYLIKLEEHKVIERRSDPNDKRKSVIHLTPLGINRREIAKKVVIDFNENVKSHFEKEEMDTFFAILKKINKIIDSTK
jgi:DNA-binding MarR family transcriptional regulator